MDTQHSPGGATRSVVELPEWLSATRIRAQLLPLRRTPKPQLYPVRAPFTGSELYRLPLTEAADVAAIAQSARAAQRAWGARSTAERAAVLLRWHDAVLNHADELADLIQVEGGKARADAFEEVADVANTLRYYGLSAAAILAPRRRRGALPLLTRVTELRHPHGLIGVISPWNYPLSLAAGDVAPALVAGNAVVHKPDSQTMLTALFARELAVAAGLPAGLWQVVAGDGDVVGPVVIDHADHVVFTGSTKTGRKVAARAGSRLVGADLELGGKNALIVCEDAQLGGARGAVAGAVRGSFASAGQLCLSFERIYVHEHVADDFIRRFIRATTNLSIGAGFSYRHDLGSLIGPAQLATVQEHVADAERHGARVLTGGRHRPDLGPYFFEPTVLTDVPRDALCFAAETFGPVVSVYRVGSHEEAIRRANDSDYGLNAAVYSRSRARASLMAAQIQAGTVNINEPYAAAWGSVDAPMGGVKSSGVGRRHGRQGLLTYTWAQTIAAQRGRPVGPSGLLRGARYQTAMTAGLRLLKTLRWR